MVKKMRVASAMAMPMLIVWVGVKSVIIYGVEGSIDNFRDKVR